MTGLTLIPVAPSTTVVTMNPCMPTNDLHKQSQCGRSKPTGRETINVQTNRIYLITVVITDVHASQKCANKHALLCNK